MPSSLGPVPHPPMLLSEFSLGPKPHSHLPTPCLLVVFSEFSIPRGMARVQEGLGKQTIFRTLSSVAFEMEMKYKLKLSYQLLWGQTCLEF